MPKTKEQKKEVLHQLNDHLDKQTAVAFVDFKGLNVKQINALRAELKQQGAKMVVAKKTLLQKAFAEKGIEADFAQIDGQIAAAFAFEDPVVAIKTIHTFAKSNEQLKIVGGYFENQIQQADQMIVIASLPSREELLAKAVGSMAAPLSGFMNVLQGNIKGLVVALSAIAEKKQ